jgi:hypothetical protein
MLPFHVHAFFSRFTYKEFGSVFSGILPKRQCIIDYFAFLEREVF